MPSGERSKEERQSRIRRVLIDYGPTVTGDFMFRSPKLNQNERDKALDEMEQAGEISRSTDFTGRVLWHLTIKAHNRG
jgi:hypothetical protein